MLFLITFFVFLVAMAAMALKLLLGRSAEFRRGCGAECACDQAALDRTNAPITHKQWKKR